MRAYVFYSHPGVSIQLFYAISQHLHKNRWMETATENVWWQTYSQNKRPFVKKHRLVILVHYLSRISQWRPLNMFVGVSNHQSQGGKCVHLEENFWLWKWITWHLGSPSLKACGGLL